VQEKMAAKLSDLATGFRPEISCPALMFQSELCEFPWASCLAGKEKLYDSSRLDVEI
jgi:hypothetical protein